jgi:hypothetical protein
MGPYAQVAIAWPLRGLIILHSCHRVERVEKHTGIVAPVADALEARHAIVAAGDRLTVDNAGARAQPRNGIHDQAETMGEVAAVACRALPAPPACGR